MARKMARREFVAASGAMALSGMALAAGAEEGALTGDAGAKPNVLVVHTDQHRIDCLGAYGNPDIRTPHIDRLAAEGARFENSFCPYPVCTPSRYSLLSGQYVNEHRGWSNHCTLPPGTPTFATVLRAAGYQTKAVGKMHFTPTYLDVGFDELVLAEQNGDGRWDDDYHRALRKAGLVDRNDLEDQERIYRNKARAEYWETFGALTSNLPDAWHSSQWIADRAVETLEGWDGGGHLLMAGFIKPHHPFDPPPSFADAYDPEALTLLPGWIPECLPRDLEPSRGYFPNDELNEKALRRAMAYYYATIEHIDREVGRMVAVLKRKGLYDRTMIVFTSDHGEYLGFHHLLLKGNYMYDPLVKIPLIIKYPNGVHAGMVSEGLVNNLDVAPTIVKQTGCVVPESMRGNDLAGSTAGRDVIFCEHSQGNRAMARTATRKLILTRKEEKPLFFDLEKDPLEMENLFVAPGYQEEVKALTQAITDWRSFDDLPRTFVDEDAPVIEQPNVPDGGDDHRREMMAYCREKMKGFGG